MQRRATGWTAALAALGTTAALAGCGSSAGSDGVTLKLVAADYGNSAADSSKTYWNRLAREYEADHPHVKVDVRVYPWTDVDRRVKEMVDEGRAPDIAQIGSYADYAAQDKLYSADDLLSIPVQANFLTALSEAGQVDRVQYGLPFVSSTRLLFYNKTLFKDAGIGRPPQSWTELQADAKRLKAHGVKTPYALPLGPEEAPAEAMMWLLSGGDNYTDNVGSYNIDSKTNINTFDWLRNDLVGEGLTGPVPPASLNRATAFEAFTKGEVGMLNGHPTLMQMADEKNVKYGMVPMPGINGRAQGTMGVADWLMAFKQNGHRAEAGAFLDSLYSDKNVLGFCREYDLLPTTTSASRAMAADQAGKAGRKGASLAPFLKELPNAQLYPVDKTSWSTVSADLKKQIGKAVSPEGSPSSILGQLQRQAFTADNAE